MFKHTLVLTFITLTCFRNTSVLTTYVSGVKCNENVIWVSVLRLSTRKLLENL